MASLEDPDTKEKPNWTPQVYGTLVVCLATLSLGSNLGYPTKALPQLRNETNSSIHLDEYQGSIFAAIFWISGVVFSPLGGVLSGWLGRRKIILLATPLVAFGWLIIGIAPNKAILFIGRAVTSSAVCAHISSINVYISETVHPSIRSNLVILPAFFMALGTLLVWILGYFIDWRLTAYLLMIPPLALAFLIIPLPETPYWLVEDDDAFGAKKSLQFYRGKNYDVTKELDEIKQKHQSKMRNSNQKHWRYTMQRIASAAFLKPFSCIGGLYIIGTWTGFNSLLVYMIDILEASGSNIDPNIGPIVVGSIRLVFAGIAPFFVNKFPPRWLFFIGQCLSALAMGVISLFVFLRDFHSGLPYLEWFEWIPLAMVIVSVIMRASGILPILHTLMSEVFPTEIRTQAIGITQASFLASGAFGVKLFPEMKNTMGLHGLCFMYCLVGLLNAIWGAYTIPDNRGKSLVKVEENYENSLVTKVNTTTDAEEKPPC